jgi:hypothetical protein
MLIEFSQFIKCHSKTAAQLSTKAMYLQPSRERHSGGREADQRRRWPRDKSLDQNLTGEIVVHRENSLYPYVYRAFFCVNTVRAQKILTFSGVNYVLRKNLTI